MDYIIVGLAAFGMLVLGVNLAGLVWIILHHDDGYQIPDKNLTSVFLLEGIRELEKKLQK